MPALDVRGWRWWQETQWQNGDLVQLLAVIRNSDEEDATFIVTVEQVSPEEPAIVTAEQTQRFRLDPRSISVESAMTDEEINALQQRFRRLPGTPSTVSFRHEIGELV